jgi:hypothetical protein
MGTGWGELREEARRLAQEQLLLRQIYSRTETDYFNWVLLVYSRLQMPLYAWADFGGRLKDVDGMGGDPRAYALMFSYVRLHTHLTYPSEPGQPATSSIPDPGAEWDKAFNSIKRNMWLNLADYGLAAGLTRSIQYVRSGDRTADVPALQIGRWGVVPGARYTLTPIGPETAVDVRIFGAEHLSHVSVRSVATVTGKRAWGAGVEITPRGLPRWRPEARLDLFQRAGDPSSPPASCPVLGRASRQGRGGPYTWAGAPSSDSASATRRGDMPLAVRSVAPCSPASRSGSNSEADPTEKRERPGAMPGR